MWLFVGSPSEQQDVKVVINIHSRPIIFRLCNYYWCPKPLRGMPQERHAGGDARTILQTSAVVDFLSTRLGDEARG